jgi:hypothetical protein
MHTFELIRKKDGAVIGKGSATDEALDSLFISLHGDPVITIRWYESAMQKTIVKTWSPHVDH